MGRADGAVELQRVIASLKGEEVKDFQEELGFYGLYSYGTHTVAYFKRQNVRVVDMSRRYNIATIKASLTPNGMGRDARERKEMANKLFEVERERGARACRSFGYSLLNT